MKSIDLRFTISVDMRKTVGQAGTWLEPSAYEQVGLTHTTNPTAATGSETTASDTVVAAPAVGGLQATLVSNTLIRAAPEATADKGTHFTYTQWDPMASVWGATAAVAMERLLRRVVGYNVTKTFTITKGS